MRSNGLCIAVRGSDETITYINVIRDDRRAISLITAPLPFPRAERYTRIFFSQLDEMTTVLCVTGENFQAFINDAMFREGIGQIAKRVFARIDACARTLCQCSPSTLQHVHVSPEVRITVQTRKKTRQAMVTKRLKLVCVGRDATL